MANDIAILVISCDKYSSLWSLFFSRLKKYWPDCNLPLYLLSNKLNFHRANVETINTGPDIDWSSNLQIALKSVNAEYLLLMLDDAPLDANVDNKKFLQIIEEMKSLDFNYLNLKASPQPPLKLDSTFGIYPPGLIYRTALVPCIWKKEVLQSLLISGESAWQFEIRGSSRSDQYDHFYSLNSPFFRILHCIIGGKFDLRAYRDLKRSGELAGISFKPMKTWEYLAVRIAECRALLGQLLPYKIRSKLRNIYFQKILNKTDWV